MYLLSSANSNVLLLFFMGGLRGRVGLAWMSYDLAAYLGKFSVGLLKNTIKQTQQVYMRIIHVHVNKLKISATVHM